jgi:hypothetical protein
MQAELYFDMKLTNAAQRHTSPSATFNVPGRLGLEECGLPRKDSSGNLSSVANPQSDELGTEGYDAITLGTP